MSERSGRKKDVGIGNVRFDMSAEDTSSRAMYNLAIGLTVVAGCAINFLMSKFLGGRLTELVEANPIITLILYFVGSIAGISIVNKTENPTIGVLGFALLAVSMGLILVSYLGYYTDASITTTFLITMGITLIMTLAATAFPAFFSSIGRGLGIMLLITVIAELACAFIFFRGQDLKLFDYAIIFLFCGYIGFDWTRAQQRPSTITNAIRSAAAIYVDVINIFIRILSIMGKRRD